MSQVSEQVDAMQISQGQIWNVTPLASEWKSSAGGLTTLNRELAIHLSQIQNVRVSLLVPEDACNDEDKREARSFGISILNSRKCVGVEPLLWLSSPPEDHKMDVIVGHGVKLGCQVQFIKRHPNFENCKWVHVVHTAPEVLSKYKKAIVAQFQEVKRSTGMRLIFASVLTLLFQWDQDLQRLIIRICKNVKKMRTFLSLFQVCLSVSLEIYLQSKTPKMRRMISLCCCVDVVMKRILN